MQLVLTIVYVSREVGHITRILSHDIYIDMQRYININAWMNQSQPDHLHILIK